LLYKKKIIYAIKLAGIVGFWQKIYINMKCGYAKYSLPDLKVGSLIDDYRSKAPASVSGS